MQEKSKKLMKELVKSSATHSSLDRAFDILNFNKSQIKAILKKFNKIGVSPVVIPRRYEFDTIRNPLDLALSIPIMMIYAYNIKLIFYEWS